MQNTDVVIIGAGAAGLMCAIEAGKRGRRVVVIDHANKVGKKILMSGGGRCNFTNYYITPDNYLSHNPHFCKSALSRYTQWDFIELVKQHNIPFHEKTLGQLFCNNKSKDIVEMLLAECNKFNVSIHLKNEVTKIQKKGDNDYLIECSKARTNCQSLVIATGGLSIPTMGASPFAYKVAEQFNIKVWPTSAALVPFTLDKPDKERYAPLSGISADGEVSVNGQAFRESVLFTHRGLSGPAILQISSYWRPGQSVSINFLPEECLIFALTSARESKVHKQVSGYLSAILPKRLIEALLPEALMKKKITECSNADIKGLAELVNDWQIKPNGTEGYRTAEVTLGGVDCDAISSKTMEVNKEKGLYFIGEALDVTGWLGGYNFQWAWSSGWAAGQNV